jgi:hypothetical protein
LTLGEEPFQKWLTLGEEPFQNDEEPFLIFFLIVC